MTGKRGRKSGFTLVEVLMVVAIIGLLAGIAAVGLRGHLIRAQIRTTKLTCENVKGAIATYEMEEGKMPPNLEALVAPRPGGPLLDQDDAPTDAWGNELKFALGGGRIRVSSPGPGGSFGTEDDIRSR